MQTTFHFGFIGLGLIGGSLARTLRSVFPDCQITAYDPDTASLSAALEDQILTTACSQVDSSFSSCTHVFLCAPVIINIQYLPLLKNLLPKSCILSDVGSVKTGIHNQIIAHGLEEQFIGGHPMTGSEKSGYSASSDHLLENAYYVITPSRHVAKEKVDAYVSLVKKLSAIPIVLDYEEHDRITSTISHVPHIIASALVNLVRNSDSPDEKMRAMAAGGFKDITRIASSSSLMWQQICLSNSAPIEQTLDAYIASLQNMKQAVHDKNKEAILHFFQEARDYRDSIPDRSYGPIRPNFVLYCDLIDEAGGIAALATILASNHISIKNIGILHNREFEEGVLQIEFYDADALEQSKKLLTKYHYTIYSRD